MDIDIDSLQVANNEKQNRFEIPLGDELAFAEYELRPDCVIFTHTEVPPSMSGKGVAAKLVRHALDDVRARNLRVVPLCAYVASFIKRNPEYAELVQQDV